MTLALGLKAPLDFSVFTAAAGAFLLAVSSGRKAQPIESANPETRTN
jgi:hypothetical protein